MWSRMRYVKMRTSTKIRPFGWISFNNLVVQLTIIIVIIAYGTSGEPDVVMP